MEVNKNVVSPMIEELAIYCVGSADHEKLVAAIQKTIADFKPRPAMGLAALLSEDNPSPLHHLCPQCSPESGGCGGNHVPPTRTNTEQPVDCREAFAKYCEITQEKYEKICGQMLHYTSAIRYLAEKLNVCPYKMTWDAAIATKREAVTLCDAERTEMIALMDDARTTGLSMGAALNALLERFELRRRGRDD